MIDTIIDNTTNIDEYKDKNTQQGQRIRKYTNINKFFDNYLRVSYKLMIRDYIFLVISLTLIFMFSYNKFINGVDELTNINDIKQDLIIMFEVAIPNYLNGFIDKINFAVDMTNIGQIRHIEHFKVDLETYVINYTIFYYIAVICLIVSIKFILILYQFYTQKILFNSSLITYFIPHIFLYHFFNRYNGVKGNNYIYIKLIKHQQNKNIMTNSYDKIVRNIFSNDNIDLDTKIHLIEEPKKFLFIYDYIKLSYKLQDNKTKEFKEIVKPPPAKVKNKKVNTDKKTAVEKVNTKISENTIQEIKNNQEELLQNLEDNDIKELEILDLELLEQLDIN